MKLSEIKYQKKVKINPRDALLVIDVQPDFMPGGSLAVAEGDQVVKVINKLMPLFSLRVASQDWHPKNHSSFKTNSPQGIWPPHCIQNSAGAKLHSKLKNEYIDVVIRKGTNPAVDSYSAFRDNDKKSVTGLVGLLQEKRAKRVFITGLALDFCVRFSAEDAQEKGFDVFVVVDACRSVKLPGQGKKGNSEEQALDVLQKKGVKFVQSLTLLA